MVANPDNAGSWPIPQVMDAEKEAPPPPPVYWAKQNWESVVKKGNSAYSDDMVEIASQKKPEPIIRQTCSK